MRSTDRATPVGQRLARASDGWATASTPRSSQPGIAEVAALSGVSRATVSRALRGLPGVAASTRQVVVDAARQLQYQPSPAAVAVASGRTWTIGISAPARAQSMMYAVIEGVVPVVRGSGFELLFTPGDGLPPNPRRVDGLLAVDISDAAGSSPLEQWPGPLVTVGHRLHGRFAVVPDHRRAGEVAAEYLLALGHRRIAVVGGAPDDRVAGERVIGFERALGRAGLAIPDRWRLHQQGVAAGRVAAAALCHQAGGPPAVTPTAVFAVTDETAAGVVDHVRRSGLPVGEQMSVIGAGGKEIAQQMSVTTVDQQLHTLGNAAAHLLLGELSALTRSPTMTTTTTTTTQFTVGPWLVERRSTRPP